MGKCHKQMSQSFNSPCPRSMKAHASISSLFLPDTPDCSISPGEQGGIAGAKFSSPNHALQPQADTSILALNSSLHLPAPLHTRFLCGKGDSTRWAHCFQRSSTRSRNSPRLTMRLKLNILRHLVTNLILASRWIVNKYLLNSIDSGFSLFTLLKAYVPQRLVPCC